MSNIAHRFDWYQASVPMQPEALAALLLGSMPQGTRTVDGHGRNSFKHRRDYVTPDDEVIATAMHGGVNPHPNVTSSGDHAPALAGVLRTLCPVHRVSRLDVAIDMRGEGVFDDVVRVMGRVRRNTPGLKGEKILPDDLDDGSTYYLGGPSSALRVRCYEKAKQLFKLTGDPVWRPLFDWTRLELQVRPEKAFKSTAAAMAPEAFWGCASWTRSLASGVLALDPAGVEMKPTRIADHERAMRAFTAQYGQTIKRQVSKLGSWEAFTDDLKHRLGVDADEDREAA